MHKKSVSSRWASVLVRKVRADVRPHAVADDDERGVHLLRRRAAVFADTVVGVLARVVANDVAEAAHVGAVAAFGDL